MNVSCLGGGVVGLFVNCVCLWLSMSVFCDNLVMKIGLLVLWIVVLRLFVLVLIELLMVGEFSL